MKQFRIIIVSFMLGIGIFLIKCSGNNPVSSYEPGLPRTLNKSEIDLISSNDKFALKLFREIVNSEDEKNIFISPLSVGFALGMTYNGAEGSTEEAMRSTLEFGELSREEINESYKSLMELLVNLDEKVILRIANAIWYRLGLNVKQEFINICKTYFDAEIDSLKFSYEDLDIINGWVNEKTNGKIKEIIKEFPEQTAFVLMNAIYFKGIWKYEFDPEKTYDTNFHLPDGSETSCRMMTQEGDFLYQNTDNFEAIDLPYGKGDFRMTVILPHRENNINDIITGFNQENWENRMNGFTEQEGEIHIPRFKFEYEIKLNQVLKDIGMAIAFGTLANFEGMAHKWNGTISEVRHKTFVEVNEEGTEAAAVTAVIMTDSAMQGDFCFRADRPFIFVIREANSGTILFMGKIVDPVSD